MIEDRAGVIKNETTVGNAHSKGREIQISHTHITGTSFGKGIVFDLVGRSETTADDEDR